VAAGVTEPRLSLYHPPGAAPARYAKWFDLTEGKPAGTATGYHLRCDARGWSLHRAGDERGVRVDAGAVARRAAGRTALARAIGAKARPRVLDAMAGMGRDGLTCAQLGCHVTLVEQVAAIWALVDDFAVRNAIACVCLPGDGWEYAARMDRPEVIYLDPMYPPRAKTALPGKELQYLRDLAAADDRSAAEWVARARDFAVERVVLKRRATDPPVVEPDWCVTARQVRYDVYRPARITPA
jgi:16S rRNA (guanine1516-N2)-methyltransferase